MNEKIVIDIPGFMNGEIIKLQATIHTLEAKIKTLEERINFAIEDLLSRANEDVHRAHGCKYPPITYVDLDEVIETLKGNY